MDANSTITASDIITSWTFEWEIKEFSKYMKDDDDMHILRSPLFVDTTENRNRWSLAVRTNYYTILRDKTRFVKISLRSHEFTPIRVKIGFAIRDNKNEWSLQSKGASRDAI